MRANRTSPCTGLAHYTNRLAALWVTLMLCLSTVAVTPWDGTVAGAFAGGDGTQGSPYQIANGAQLAYLAQQVNGGTTYSGTYFVLTDTIDLGNRPWTPIGQYHYSGTTKIKEAPFEGTFMGKSHLVIGLFIDKTGTTYTDFTAIGLFGYTQSATITGLLVEGLLKNSVNGVDGQNIDAVCLGGVVGYANSGTRISRCINRVTIRNTATGHSLTGGIAGWYHGSNRIDYCGNEATLTTAATSAAGLIGHLKVSATIAYCYNADTISSTSSRTAAFVGWNDGGTPTFTNCYNRGTLTKGSASFASIGNYATGANSIHNCFQKSDYISGWAAWEDWSASSTTGKFSIADTAVFQTGELAYRLNQSSHGATARPDTVWAQGPRYPVIGNAANAIRAKVTLDFENQELDTVLYVPYGILTVPRSHVVYYLDAAHRQMWGVGGYDLEVTGNVTLYGVTMDNSVWVQINRNGNSLAATVKMDTATVRGYSISNKGVTYSVDYQWVRKAGEHDYVMTGETAPTLGGITDWSMAYGVLVTLTNVDSLADTYKNDALYCTGRVVFVDAANGVDANDGFTPQTAVKTLSQAYSKLWTEAGGGRVEGNVIVLVGDYTGTVAFGSKPATITAKYDTIDSHASLLLSGDEILLKADTKFEQLTLRGGGNEAMLYCQGNDLTLGDGLVMNNYKKIGTRFNFGTINMSGVHGLTSELSSFHVFGGWLNYTKTSSGAEQFSATDTCHIVIRSGEYLRVAGGTRSTGSNSGTRMMGSLDVPFNVKIEVSGADTKINTLIGGQIDGSCYANTLLTVTGGTVGRLLGGSIGNGTKYSKDPQNMFLGHSVVNVSGGFVNELYGGSLGRSASNTYFYGTVSVTVSDSAEIGTNIYAAGAGGVLGYAAAQDAVHSDVASIDTLHRNPFLRKMEREGLEQEVHLAISGGTIDGNAYGGGAGFTSYLLDYKKQGDTKTYLYNNQEDKKELILQNCKSIQEFLKHLPKSGNVDTLMILAPHDAGGLYANTHVHVSGGTILGHVFGGGEGTKLYKQLIDSVPIYYPTTMVVSSVANDNYLNVAPIYGNTHVEISGSAVIEGSVFGASEGIVPDTVFVEGAVNYLKATAYKEDSSNPYAPIAKLTGKSTVEIEGFQAIAGIPFYYGKSDLACIQGGGYSGMVVGETEVLLKGGVIGSTSTMQGCVSGGGLLGKVEGNSTVLMDGNVVVGSSIFGGGCASDVTGHALAVLKEGMVTNVFGGGGVGDVQRAEVWLDPVNEEDLLVMNSVFGGGVLGDADSTLVTMKGGYVGYVRHPSTGAIIRTPSAFGTYSVYGGGYGTGADVTRWAEVSIEGGCVRRSVFGGCEEGDVLGGTRVDVHGGIVIDYVYGGGYHGHVCLDSGHAQVNVVIEPEFVQHFLNADSIYKLCTIEHDYYSSAWNLPAGHSAAAYLYPIVRGVYGGGFSGNVGSDANPSAGTTVNFKGYHVGSAPDVIIHTSDYEVEATAVDGGESVVGGGYYGDVYGNTEVNVSFARIRGNIAGGGRGDYDTLRHTYNYANVYGNTEVNVDSSKTRYSVYGGGYNYSIVGTKDNAATGNVALNMTHCEIGYMEGDSIDASIYGGAYLGSHVADSCSVRGNVHMTLTDMVSLLGSVYGGGYHGVIGGSTRIDVRGGLLESQVVEATPGEYERYYVGRSGRVYKNELGGSIYGGGMYGDVRGDSCVVTVTGYNGKMGRMAGTLFGGGMNGYVRNTRVTVDSVRIDGTYVMIDANAGGYFGKDAEGRPTFDTDAYGPYYVNRNRLYKLWADLGNADNLEPDTATTTYYVTTALNCVLGGGLNGDVTGTSMVELKGGVVGSAVSSLKRNMGYVFAGGWNGTVQDTYVRVDGDSVDVHGAVFGGGYQGNVLGSTHVTATKGYLSNLYGGGAYSDVQDSTYVTLGPNVGSQKIYLSGSVYGGGAYGNVNQSTQVTMLGGYVGYLPAGATHAQSYSGTSWTVPREEQVNTLDAKVGNVFGGGLGKGTVVKGNTTILLNADTANLKIARHVFGGGNQGDVGTVDQPGNTYLYIRGGMVAQDAYGGGDEGYVYGSTCLLVGDCSYYKCTQSGTRYLKRSDRWNRTVGGVKENDRMLMRGMLQVGDYIPKCVYDSLTDQSGFAEVPATGEIHPIYIKGGVFGGGNTEVGSTEVYAATQTVLGNTAILVHDREDGDYITLSSEHSGGVNCDGNLTLVRGTRCMEVKCYGQQGTDPKLINCFQRADLLTITDSNIKLYDARDFSPHTPDGRTYSLTRIGELQLNSSADKNKTCYVAFYNPVNYLGCLKSNVSMTDTYLDANGAILSADTTYAMYKQVRRGKESRNVGTSRNRIAVANGNNLVIQGEQGIVGTDTVTYYGPVCGVFQLSLLNSAAGEGGGYVYADNIHEEASPADWLETSGNFVFGDDESKRIVDDCYPIAGDATSRPAHYWFVQGSNYSFNVTMTCYTNLGNKTFTISDPLDLMMFPTSGGNDRLVVDSVGWKNHAESWANPGEAYVDSILCENSRYQLYMTCSPKVQANGDSVAFLLPKVNTRYAQGQAWGSVSEQNPTVNFAFNTPANSNDYEFLREGDTLTVVVRNTGYEFNGQPVTYTVHMAIVYLEGPRWTGTFTPASADLLPGGQLLFTELPSATNSGDLPITGFGWDLIPLKPDGSLDEARSMVITEDAHFLPENFSCYYYQNNYYLRYYAKTSAGNFGQMVKLQVHNYHRMKDVMYNTHIQNHMHLFKGCKVYIEDAEDWSAFLTYCNTVATCTEVDAATQRCFHPQGADSIQFYLMNNLLVPDTLQAISVGTTVNPFKGTLHGNGAVLSGLTQAFVEQAAGNAGFYNLGLAGNFTGSALASTVQSGAEVTVENCFVHTSASSGSGNPLVGTVNGTLQLNNCYYQAEKGFAGGQGVPRTAAEYEDGRLAFDLNGYYKRYVDSTPAKTDTAQYLKNYFRDGDYRFAKIGKWRSAQKDERGICSHNYFHPVDAGRTVGRDGLQLTSGSDSLAVMFIPKFPEDFRLFGQHLNGDRTSLGYPQPIAAHDTVYRVPAYCLSATRDSLYFNAQMVVEDSTLTAIDFTGAQQAKPSDLSLPAVLTGLDLGPEVSRNLLVYANAVAPEYEKLSDLLDYTETTDLSAIRGHLITCSSGSRTLSLMRLVDKQNLNVPLAFEVTDSICYIRQPEVWADGSRGWETLVLPFEATLTQACKPTAAGDSLFAVQHFYGDQGVGKDFWLREYYSSERTLRHSVGNTFDTDSLVYFNRPQEQTVQANKPYLMAFPGDTFHSLTKNHSLEGVSVVFSAKGYTLQVTDLVDAHLMTADEKSRFHFVGSFTKSLVNGTATDAVGAGCNGYVLDKAGGCFIRPQQDSLELPFRAVMLEAPNYQPMRRTRALGIESAGTDEELLEQQPQEEEKAEKPCFSVRVEGRRLVVCNTQPRLLHLYTATGKLVEILHLEAGEWVIPIAEAGLYLLEREKLVVL